MNEKSFGKKQEGEVQRLTEKKLSKKVRNHQVVYTVTTIGKRTALHRLQGLSMQVCVEISEGEREVEGTRQPLKNRRDIQLDITEYTACK